MASTPARDLPLLTGPLTGLLLTGRVCTGAEGDADGDADGAGVWAGDEAAAWPQRSQ
ncbi:hypothetical protein [Nonomuraea gerenzanensis]|uniref:Uncharacterized protein n=1 Tax=Nonomuraea gerenzanensis TaxID=93944 RepID=A0A1M4E479_9ACTN|nr:hypothetical protein [Nonomuraea gerenzanensis]UBU15846.1 hypothetical protein LCN96_12790 [Nonomuraea gerenzanensis]SBO93637.1 hypothetical protein BN4615_P3151 [Nonomuraea gerenzanensis]